MIASLEGVVTALGATSLVLEVGGVGYRVHAGPGTLSALAQGSRVRLHTHHLVREDLQSLYGFRTTEELGFFELITTVSGVGPKVGLAIVSSRPVADLELAILQGDEAVLVAVPGVGKRLAARIVLELREKVATAGAGARSDGSGESEVVAALEALGYTSREGREV
jgi:Holliday junction DNA helicase RuvA